MNALLQLISGGWSNFSQWVNVEWIFFWTPILKLWSLKKLWVNFENSLMSEIHSKLTKMCGVYNYGSRIFEWISSFEWIFKIHSFPKFTQNGPTLIFCDVRVTNFERISIFEWIFKIFTHFQNPEIHSKSTKICDVCPVWVTNFEWISSFEWILKIYTFPWKLAKYGAVVKVSI